MSLRKAVKDVLDTQKALQHDAWETAGEYNHLLNEANKALKALRQAYAEPYVPMTDDEKSDFARSMVKETRSVNWLVDKIEAAVLARLGIGVGK